MLMTESQLRLIIKHSIILEEKKKKEDAAENNEELTAVVEELEELPGGFMSKLNKAVQEDIESIEEQPVGDEAVFVLGAAAGLNDAGEDVWWTGLDMDDPNCWYHKWHHFYQKNCESFGALILKLFGNKDPSTEQIEKAGRAVFLTCTIIMTIMSGAGALHALHDHNLWLICGETIMSCVEYGEVMMILSTICAVAAGHDIHKHAKEHGIESKVSA